MRRRRNRTAGAARRTAVARAIHGDCLAVMQSMPARSVDLVYMDPPFATGRVMISRNGSYPDRWNGRSHYIEFLTQRITAARRLLKPTGSILVHCDWRASHHIRLILDATFGEDHFVNHIVWHYGLGGSSARRFARKHDDILFYAVHPADYYFDPPRVPATSQRLRGQTKKATDVLDIPSINNMAAERTGYPTQKPLALLDVLVRACSPPGGMVLDPFCGSGTAVMAALTAGRSASGIDSSAHAVRLTRRRIQQAERTMSLA